MPAMPLVFQDAPQPANSLLQTMASGYVVEAPYRPEVHRLCRRAMPALVGNFFPHPDTPLAPSLSTTRALLYALRLCSDALPHDPVLWPYLNGLCTSLERAGIVTAWLMQAPASQDRVLCADWLLPMLARREPVLLPGGYAHPDGGHATGLYFWPLGVDATLLVVANRAEDAPHPVEHGDHPLPLVYRFKTVNLLGEAGLAFLCAVLALQRPDPAHNIGAFYNIVQQAVSTCQGDVEVGFDGEGKPREELHVGGQTRLRTDTCIVNSALTVLHFGLHAAFDTLDPCAPEARWEAVQALYKQIKAHCRELILEQFVTTLKQIRCHGDPAEVSAYEAALVRTREYVDARAHKPGMAACAAQLATLNQKGLTTTKITMPSKNNTGSSLNTRNQR